MSFTYHILSRVWFYNFTYYKIIENIYWSLPPCSWHRDSETLAIFWVRGVSFVLVRWLWVGSWMTPDERLVSGKTKLGILSLYPSSHTLEKGKGLKMVLMIDHAHVMNPHKKSQQYAGELPGWWTYHVVAGYPHPDSLGTGATVLLTLSDLALCISPSGRLSVSFTMSFNKLISVSLSSQELL